MKISTGGALLRKELQDASYLEAHPEAYELFKMLDVTGSARSSRGTIRVSQRHFPKSLMDLKFNLGLL
jgi:hypothetical protein